MTGCGRELKLRLRPPPTRSRRRSHLVGLTCYSSSLLASRCRYAQPIIGLALTCVPPRCSHATCSPDGHSSASPPDLSSLHDSECRYSSRGQERRYEAVTDWSRWRLASGSHTWQVISYYSGAGGARETSSRLNTNRTPTLHAAASRRPGAISCAIASTDRFSRSVGGALAACASHQARATLVSASAR